MTGAPLPDAELALGRLADKMRGALDLTDRVDPHVLLAVVINKQEGLRPILDRRLDHDLPSSRCLCLRQRVGR